MGAWLSRCQRARHGDQGKHPCPYCETGHLSPRGRGRAFGARPRFRATPYFYVDHAIFYNPRQELGVHL